MKTLSVRGILAAATLSLVVLVASAPALARHNSPEPMATPTLAPLYALASPPPTVAQASAIDACANDAFLAYRTIPIPTQSEVTVCGTALGSGGMSNGRGASHPSFELDVDGTDPIDVVTDGPSVSVKPGDIIVVRGRYHRENGGAEGINETHTTNGRGWTFDGYLMVNGTIYR